MTDSADEQALLRREWDLGQAVIDARAELKRAEAEYASFQSTFRSFGGLRD